MLNEERTYSLPNCLFSVQLCVVEELDQLEDFGKGTDFEISNTWKEARARISTHRQYSIQLNNRDFLQFFLSDAHFLQ